MRLQQSARHIDKSITDISATNYKRVFFTVVLSFIPGLGQVYTGHPTRGIVAYIGLILLSWLSALLFLWVKFRTLRFVFLIIPFVYALAICVDAVFCVIRQNMENTVNNFGLLLRIFIFLLLFFSVITLMDYLVGKHVVRAFFVTTNSMAPNIIKHDLILIDKLSEPQRQDVVLVDFSSNSDNVVISNVITDQTLRRVIASEGDTVEIRGKTVFLNNSPLNENYIFVDNSFSINQFTDDNFHWGPETVPENSYFVLADSRQYSFDSRTFGFIDYNHISGIASKVLWSWNLEDGHFKWKRTALNIN